MTNTMTNLLNKRDALEMNFRCTGNPVCLKRLEAIDKEIICEYQKWERKKRATNIAFEVLRVTLLVLGLFMVAWTSAMFIRSIGFKFMYAIVLTFIGFLADCGIEWLQAKVKNS